MSFWLIDYSLGGTIALHMVIERLFVAVLGKTMVKRDIFDKNC